MHLAETPGGPVLLDCGLSFEHRYPRGFPFRPDQLRAVILTHAHLDHSGMLPALVRQGCTAPIYCTPATKDLLAALLFDSARIQEEEAFRALLRDSRGRLVEPLYRVTDAERALDQCIPVPFDEVFEPTAGVEAWLRPAGHVLGAAMIHLRCRYSGESATLTYTGDLGRSVLPLHSPPAPVPPADLVLCESTYGGTHHEPLPQLLEDLASVIKQTLARDGKVLLPAFSLGRTQLLAHFLLVLAADGRIPICPVNIDSPLAAQITAIYRQRFAELGLQVRSFYGHDPKRFLVAPHLRFVTDPEESRELSLSTTPGIIIASSGMGEGGRIVQHLWHGVDDPRNTIVLVSFQAPGTLGARLLMPGPTVRLLGRDVNKWADVVQLRGFSAHADQEELLESLREVLNSPARVVLVHGDQSQSASLAQAIHQRGQLSAKVAEVGRTWRWREPPVQAPKAAPA
jgi:metallo-beta-lactamase family protein